MSEGFCFLAGAAERMMIIFNKIQKNWKRNRTRRGDQELVRFPRKGFRSLGLRGKIENCKYELGR